MAFGCAPTAIASDAAVWRRSWNRSPAKPADAVAGCQILRLKLLARIGMPSRVVKTKSVLERSASCSSSSEMRNRGIVMVLVLAAALKGLEVQKRRSGVWILNDPPIRPADVYVFCLHEALPATNKNVADQDTWTFWVVATDTLDVELGDQKSLGLKRLDVLARRVAWEQIRTTVDECQLP